MAKVVRLSDEVVKKLDSLRHTGQSYDGVLRELLGRLQKHDNSMIQQKDTINHGRI